MFFITVARESNLFKLRIYTEEWNSSSRKVKVYEKIKKKKVWDKICYDSPWVGELPTAFSACETVKKMCLFFGGVFRVSVPRQFWKQWLQAYR